MDTNIYQQIEDNWRMIGQALAGRNVQHADLAVMREAYIRSVMSRYNGESNAGIEFSEFWVSNEEEQKAIIFLEDRDFLVYKKHCGRAVVKEQVK